MERSFVFNVFSGEAAGIDGEGGGGQTGLGGLYPLGEHGRAAVIQPGPGPVVLK